MIVYPLAVLTDSPNLFRVHFVDIPQEEFCGSDLYLVIATATDFLGRYLAKLYASGQQMATFSYVESGQIGIPAPFSWHM